MTTPEGRPRRGRHQAHARADRARDRGEEPRRARSRSSASTVAAPTSPPACTGSSPTCSSQELPAGEIDIAFYRDDFATREAPEVRSSHLPFRLEDHTVVLVDDALYTGRTVRAAIDALFDYGRPARCPARRAGRPRPIGSSRSAPTTSARTSRPTAPSA